MELNNHLMEDVKHLDHKIQPETESVMKMIMENPFVVRQLKNISIHIHKEDHKVVRLFGNKKLF
jgi:hypothetical protein